MVERLKQTYSIFSQAYLMAVRDNGAIEDWDLGSQDSQEGAKKLYDILKPYINKVKECETDSGCFYSGTYKSLFGSQYAWQPSTHNVYSRGVLANGTTFATWSAGSGCKTNMSISGTGKYSHACGAIHVDINGDKAPNKAGVDYFSLLIARDGILPSGGKDYKSPYNLKCKYQDTSNTNGEACAYWVIAKGNMDYRRRDISNQY